MCRSYILFFEVGRPVVGSRLRVNKKFNNSPGYHLYPLCKLLYGIDRLHGLGLPLCRFHVAKLHRLYALFRLFWTFRVGGNYFSDGSKSGKNLSVYDARRLYPQINIQGQSTLKTNQHPRTGVTRIICLFCFDSAK